MNAKARKISQIQKLLSPEKVYPRYFLLCLNGSYKLQIEDEFSSNCEILTLDQVKKHLKYHRYDTHITIYKTPGMRLPAWTEGLEARVLEILPGHVSRLTAFLKHRFAPINTKFPLEKYLERLTQEERYMLVDYSRISRRFETE